MLKSFIGFYSDFICIKNIACFKKKYFGSKKNVHPVLNILTRRGKVVLSFLDFYLFFYEFFGGTF